MSRSFRWIVAPLVAVAFAAQVSAQEQNQNTQQQEAQQQAERQQAGQQQADQPGQLGDRQQSDRLGQHAEQAGQAGAQNADEQIAAWLIVANDAEIQLAQSAQQKAQHPQVREFIQMISQDHNRMNEQLARFAPQALRLQGQGNLAQSGRTLRGQPGQPGQPQPGQPQQGQPQPAQSQPGQPEPARAGQADDAQQIVGRDAQQNQGQVRTGARLDQASRGGSGLPMMQVAQQLGERAVQTIQQELGRYNERDFDAAFLTFQVMQHLGMINEMEVLGQYASPELRQLIDQGKQGAQQHLTEARQLLVQVAQASGRQGRTGDRQQQGQFDRNQSNQDQPARSNRNPQNQDRSNPNPSTPDPQNPSDPQ